jgi:ATP-dependent DNA helicase RecG
MHKPLENEAQALDRASPAALLERLKRMGIVAWHEPLLCLPQSFLEFSKPCPLREAINRMREQPGVAQTLNLLVSEKAQMLEQPRKRLVLYATDGMYKLKIVIFIVPGVDVPSWKRLQEGSRIHIRGTLQIYNDALQFTNPTLIDPAMIGKTLPVYETRRGVVAKGAIFNATRYAIKHHMSQTVQHLVESFNGLSEQEILRKAHLRAAGIVSVLRAAHTPGTLDEGLRGQAAMRRMAALSIVENARAHKQRSPVAESALPMTLPMIAELARKLPYPLTQDQRQTMREIVADMDSPLPMKRVLSGDVGCGKTLPIMLTALATQKLGRRAAILTPNSLLAEQFVSECKGNFGDDTRVVSVTSSTKLLDLDSNPILVGTTALLHRLKDEPPPAFLAVDEEQKLSVAQKAQLTGLASNYLQATATPIPRTTALITHGGMEVSIIRQMPVKKNIATFIVEAKERKRLFEHTHKVLTMGGQIAIVYPIVSDKEQEKRSVVAAAAEWEKRFPFMVGMVHGQMKEDEKIDAVEALKAGVHKIAVVSSVIEIGITLPSLRSIIVVHPERYGTSTLHQFRGRVARQGGNGYFFMFLPDPVSDDTRQRLQLLVEYNDGFTLSEKDAEMRGYGDLFEHAERQSGNSRSSVFRCVDLTPSDIHAVSNSLAQ